MKEYTVKVHDNGDRCWYVNDKLHREDGPAVEWADGHRSWWVNGNRHRTDGPAFEGADGHREWWVNGNRHRTDGPAIEWADGKREWWVNGKRMTEQEFNDYTNPTKELTVAEIEKLLGYRVKVVNKKA